MIAVNGKFTVQAITGVQRVAHELLRAVDHRLSRFPSRRHYSLYTPPGAQTPAFEQVRAHSVPRRGPLHVWEQFHLPRAFKGDLLLNLTGSAPLRAGRQGCFLHDAAVFDCADAYSSAFVNWYRMLFRQHVRSDQLLLTVSDFSRERLARALRVPEHRFHVVPLGSDHIARVAPDVSVLDQHGLQEVPFLLAVGSANRTKNLPALVRAWRQLRRSDARLVIVGGGNSRVFSGDAEENSEGILRLGYLGDEPLKALYQSARGLVFPSLYEGFGLPPLEAMSCGCPVAVSNAAAIPEVCGDAALYFDPGSVEEIAEAMRVLLEGGNDIEHLRQRGLLRARQFSWDTSAATLMKTLEGVE